MRLVLLLLFVTPIVYSQPVLLDDFSSIEDWEIIASDGVILSVSGVEGVRGQAIRLDFEFQAGAGFCGIRKSFSQPLDENYRFSYYLRGNMRRNNLEFKLLDASGENVWWHNRRNFEFPETWEELVTRKRHVGFAWGPDRSEPDTLHALEFIIAAGEGGSGSLYIDELRYEPIPVIDFASLEPEGAASTSMGDDYGPEHALDGDTQTYWMSSGRPPVQWFRVDMGERTELGGLVIDWFGEYYAVDYDVLLSGDGLTWDTLYTVIGGTGGRDYVYIREGDARYVQLNLQKAASSEGYAISALAVQPVGFSATPNVFFRKVASDRRRGLFPRFLFDEQSYWTVVGVNSDPKEGLLNEDGMLEVDKESFSIEPMLFIDGALITWSDVRLSQSLQSDYLPVPSVLWEHDGVQLHIEVIADGEPGASSMYASYTLKNTSGKEIDANLFLLLRPFQVNPPWQFLNINGGFAPVNSIKYADDSAVTVNGSKKIIPFTKPDGFGATSFERADIVDYIERGVLPEDFSVTSESGFASGALQYTFSLDPDEERRVILKIPFYDDDAYAGCTHRRRSTRDGFFSEKLDKVSAEWEEILNGVQFTVPPEGQKYIDVLRSNVAYVLINRDGPAIQPGSRSYERSWIRDGSLTSGALLRLGLHEPVREFIKWYAPYQYDNGKIPCVVDRRGPDPVDEHDSPGQFIYLIMEYYRFTRDTTFLRNKWDRVRKTVDYIDYLIDQRKTDEYRTGSREMRAYYGLVPESISHEGYAEKPMHSYWDNFFVLKGLKDAARMAEVLGEEEHAARYRSMRDEFRKNLYNSILLAMDLQDIEYIPGCVELGDFDATSTTIGIFPCGELRHIPHTELMATFEKYYENFRRRLDPEYEWRDYTPYEVRAAGTYIFLDQRDRTHELLDFFFDDLRPYEWNHWAEVVWRDYRMPRFIGDMPHTWVGSDYINVIRNMFLYDVDEERRIVIGAGIPESWIDSETGIGVRNLPTYYGKIHYSMKGDGEDVSVSIHADGWEGDVAVELRSPRERPITAVTVDGTDYSDFDESGLVIHTLPADIVIRY
jgi:hypothetical protein